MDRIALGERHRRIAIGSDEVSCRMARAARTKEPFAPLTLGAERLSRQRDIDTRAEANATRLYRRG